jgi:AraC-like DNA-binding protein
VILEEVAADCLHHRHPDPLAQEVARLVGSGRAVADIADAVGLSDRQLHRRSLAAFGYGPKVLGRILRLQRAIGLARAGTALSATAAEAGYFDQAHLAREVRALSGAQRRDLTR